MTEAKEKAAVAGGAGPDMRHSIAEMVRSLDRHMREHRHKSAGPVSVRINTGLEFPIMVEIRCGDLHQVCAGLLGWRESFEGEWRMWAERSADGGMLSLELTGETLEEIGCHVIDAVPWHPGLFPGLSVGRRMELGSVVVHALARGDFGPDRDYPPALACLLDPPTGSGDGQ